MRTLYYIKIIQRLGIPQLMEPEILDHIGARTLADLARHYHHKAQRQFVAMVRKKGVREAKQFINDEFRNLGLRR